MAVVIRNAAAELDTEVSRKVLAPKAVPFV